MSVHRINTGAPQVDADKFDRMIEWLLISLLAFMPLAFGAVEAWSEEVVIALVAAISVCFLLKLVLRDDAHPKWSWAYVPIALFVLVSAFQLIPLPARLAAAVSPNTVATKSGLLDDMGNSGTVPESTTLSFYPNATRHDLRLVLAVAAIFFIVVNVFRSPNQIKRLLGAIAAIGGSIALLALAQNVLGNGKIYWMVPTADGTAYSGTFINHSHYSQFMNLSIGAALALAMVKLHESFTGRKITPAAVAEYLTSAEAKVPWLLAGMIVLGMTTVVVSLSRGGVLSMLVAGAVTTLALSASRPLRGRGWVMVLLTLGATIGVLFIGFDAVCDRLTTLRQLSEIEGGRWQIVKDVATAWVRFPLLGTGLGTHEVVYPMFDRATIPALASHAENEYMQTAEETGIIGLILLLVLLVGVWISQIRIIANRSLPIRSAAYGLGFGLIAIMVHSLSDFGQHLPANSILSAISCGLLISLAGMRGNIESSEGLPGRSRLSMPLRIASLLFVSTVFAGALVGADKARSAEAHWTKALVAEQTLTQKQWQASDEEYIDLIRHAAGAATCEPANLHYRHWLNVYRWRSISRITDPNTGAVVIPEASLTFVRRIIDELNSARLLCPTYGPTCSIVGQLQMFVLGDPNGAELIRRGFRLAPSDPTVCFVAGLLDAEQGQVERSYLKLSRAVQLDGGLFDDVALLCISRLKRPDLAVELADERPNRLSYVAEALAETTEHEELAERARARAMALLREECSQPDAPAAAFASMARMCEKEGDDEAAVEYYRRALGLEYSQIQWRLSLARLLARIGRVPEAIHEAKIGLRLRPQLAAAEKLIADLSVLPAAVAQEDLSPSNVSRAEQRTAPDDR